MRRSLYIILSLLVIIVGSVTFVYNFSSEKMILKKVEYYTEINMIDSTKKEVIVISYPPRDIETFRKKIFAFESQLVHESIFKQITIIYIKKHDFSLIDWIARDETKYLSSPHSELNDIDLLAISSNYRLYGEQDTTTFIFYEGDLWYY